MYTLLQIGDVAFNFSPKDSYSVTGAPKVKTADLANGKTFVEVIKNKSIKISAGYESELISNISRLETALSTIPCTALVLDTETELVQNKQMMCTSITKTKMFNKRNTSCWGLSFELEEI